MNARAMGRWVGGSALLIVLLVASPLAAETKGRVVSSSKAEASWPRWRGPHQDGQTEEAQLPVKWGPESVTWKVELPGKGQSSPIIWNNQIYLTSYLDDGAKRIVFCVDRRDGHLLWQHEVWQGEPEKSHLMNGWASATCATDGEVVVAFFGLGGLHAFTLDGKKLWSRDLGVFESPWGVAACPIIIGDLVIQNGDSDADAFIMGLNKRTGKTVWRTPRPDNRGWSTPILIDAGGRQELVLNGHTGLIAYNPKTGKQLWSCRGFNGRGEPTVTPAGGLLCAVNGLAGDIYAVQPGGNGDVTESRMAWHTPRKGGRDTPSPIVIDHYITVVDMKGIATCYDAADGAELWKSRIGENFSASPFAAGGLAYFQGESGETTVLRPGPKPDIVAKNTVDPADEEIFRASLTPCEGQLFARSNLKLYCIGQRHSMAKN